MKVVLKPGETLEVEFEETDGTIIVGFSETDITVSANLPDTSGREGVIYQEVFGTNEKAIAVELSEPKSEPLDVPAFLRRQAV